MFGEFEEMVLYHAILVKVLLGLLVLGVVIPFLSSDCAKIIKRKRFYMFFLHGLLTAVAFSGMVAMVFAQIAFNASMLVMIVVYLALSVLESKKYLTLINEARLNPTACTKAMRVVTVKYTLISMAMVLGLLLWKMMEKADAVPLS